MALADVTLVNPVIDGMNLVAKESAIVNERDGVLILSEGAGAFEQLQDGVLGVAPEDIEGTVRALETALAMAPEEGASCQNPLLGSGAERYLNLVVSAASDIAALLPEFLGSQLARR